MLHMQTQAVHTTLQSLRTSKNLCRLLKSLSGTQMGNPQAPSTSWNFRLHDSARCGIPAAISSWLHLVHVHVHSLLG